MFEVAHYFASIQRLTAKYTSEKVEFPKLAASAVKAGDDVVKALQQYKKAADAYNKFEDGVDKTMGQLKKEITNLQKWATDMLKDPRNLHGWPAVMKGVNGAIDSVPAGNEDAMKKESAAAAKQVVDTLKALITVTEQLNRSLDKETFGVKAKGKGDDGLDKVRKLWSLNVGKLLTDLKNDLKRAEKAVGDIKKDMDVSLSRETAVAA